MKNREWFIVLFLSALLVVASWQKWVPLDLVETLAFVTGAVCVLLVVRENIWNFPIGIANNVFFIVLFYEKRLFADTGLNIVYLLLAAQGWYSWLHGGNQRAPLQVRSASNLLRAICVLAVMVTTLVLMKILQAVNGAAPFLDALTTSLSLVAQVLLNFKFIENWWLWIVADVIYVYLYFTKHLPLTAVLYAGFIGLCLMGLSQWRRSLNEAGEMETI